MSVRSFGLGSGWRKEREGRTRRRNPVPSFLPLMVLRAHLLALCLSLSLSLLRPLPYSPQECYIPCLSRSLAGFTTQFEDSPYRAPSSTQLVPEYSENSGATDRRTRGQHMSTEFLRDPRNERGILNSGKLPVMLTRSSTQTPDRSRTPSGLPSSGMKGPAVRTRTTDSAEAGPTGVQRTGPATAV